MGIDGLILVDHFGRPVIQSGFRSTYPTYPLIHVDAVNDAISKAPKAQEVDPVIYVPSLTLGNPPSACCHVLCNDIRLLCVVSGNVDPLLAFAFVQTFIDILQEYFGSVSVATVKENFDVVYQLLEETLDSGGYPLTTSLGTLKDIVLPPSLFNKLLSVAGANFNSKINPASAASGTFSSPIPWRKAGLRYASNEIYIDLIEELRAVVNKNGIVLSSIVTGKMDTNARLTGTPDCLLSFTNSSGLVDCAFHPCVRLHRWAQSKTLSFIPPDGKFILAEYRYAPNGSSLSSTPAALASNAQANVPVPFALKAGYEIEDNTVSFNLSLSSRLPARSLHNVVVELNLGEGASGIKCITSREAGGMRRGMDVPVSSAASWSFDSRKKVLKWEIAEVLPSSSWSLRGSFSTSANTPRPSRAVQVRFEIQGHTFSSLKVDQLKITGETYKPYKGFRGRCIGNVEWRW